MRVLFAQTSSLTVISLQVNANQPRQLNSQKAFDRLLDVAVEYESETLGIGNKMEIRNLILQRIENDGYESAIINPMNKLILNNQIVHS